MKMTDAVDSKGRNESAMADRYSQVNHFQKCDGGVRYVDVRDRERCGDGCVRGCAARCDNALPSSAAYRAPFQAIHS